MSDPTTWKMARIDTSNTDDKYTHRDIEVKLMEGEDDFAIMTGDCTKSLFMQTRHESKTEALGAFERKVRELAIKHNDPTI